MKHKIFVTERVLRCIYEVIIAGLLMYAAGIIFAKQEPEIIDIIWIAGCFSLSYMIRELAPSHVILAAGHILMAGLLFLLPGAGWIRVVTGAYILLYLLPSSARYAKRGSVLPYMSEPWPSILAGVLIYFASLGMHLKMLSYLAYSAVALMMAVYLMIRYVQGLKRYIGQITEVSKQSVRDIAFVNGRVVLFLAGIMLILMAACRFLKLDGLVDLITAACARVIQIVISGFMIFWIFILTLLTKGGRAAADLDYQDTVNEYYQNSADHSEIFTVILKVIVIAFLIYLLIRILMKCFQFLLKPRTYAGDRIEKFQEMEEQEQKESAARKTERKKLTKEEHARRIYKKSILRYHTDINLNSKMTSEDIRREISEREIGNVDALTSIYEEIRYGKKQVDGSVIREMKNQTKKS